MDKETRVLLNSDLVLSKSIVKNIMSSDFHEEFSRLNEDKVYHTSDNLVCLTKTYMLLGYCFELMKGFIYESDNQGLHVDIGYDHSDGVFGIEYFGVDKFGESVDLKDDVELSRIKGFIDALLETYMNELIIGFDIKSNGDGSDLLASFKHVRYMAADDYHSTPHIEYNDINNSDGLGAIIDGGSAYDENGDALYTAILAKMNVMIENSILLLDKPKSASRCSIKALR